MRSLGQVVSWSGYMTLWYCLKMRRIYMLCTFYRLGFSKRCICMTFSFLESSWWFTGWIITKNRSPFSVSSRLLSGVIVCWWPLFVTASYMLPICTSETTHRWLQVWLYCVAKLLYFQVHGSKVVYPSYNARG